MNTRGKFSVCNRKVLANIYIYASSKQRNNPTIENTCKFLTGEDYADRIEHRIVSG